jgi:hypothetical protein
MVPGTEVGDLSDSLVSVCHHTSSEKTNTVRTIKPKEKHVLALNLPLKNAVNLFFTSFPLIASLPSFRLALVRVVPRVKLTLPGFHS